MKLYKSKILAIVGGGAFLTWSVPALGQPIAQWDFDEENGTTLANVNVTSGLLSGQDLQWNPLPAPLSGETVTADDSLRISADFGGRSDFSFFDLGTEARSSGIVQFRIDIEGFNFAPNISGFGERLGFAFMNNGVSQTTSEMFLERVSEEAIPVGLLELSGSASNGSSIPAQTIPIDEPVDQLGSQTLSLIMTTDLTNDTYEISYILDDVTTSIGTGTVDDTRDANFIRLRFVEDFDNQGGAEFFDIDTITVIPEPATATYTTLLGLVVLGITGLYRRRRKA